MTLQTEQCTLSTASSCLGQGHRLLSTRSSTQATRPCQVVLLQENSLSKIIDILITPVSVGRIRKLDFGFCQNSFCHLAGLVVVEEYGDRVVVIEHANVLLEKAE